jgi:hypothetical protein
MAFTTAGCGDGDPTIDIVLITRSDATLAFLPGIVVGPCAEGSYSESEIRAAGDERVRLSQNTISGDETAWVPAGAVVIEGVPPMPIGAPRPENLVVSGVQKAYVSYGPLDRANLPACGGQPNLTEIDLPALPR